MLDTVLVTYYLWFPYALQFYCINGTGINACATSPGSALDLYGRKLVNHTPCNGTHQAHADGFFCFHITPSICKIIPLGIKAFRFYRIEVLKESGVYRTQVIKMPISARNRMAGVVKAIEKGEVASTVKIEITKPSVITAMITKEAVEELGLKEGDKVEAVIKATEVMVSKD